MLMFGIGEWSAYVSGASNAQEPTAKNTDSPRTKLAKEAKKNKPWKEMTFAEYQEWEASFSKAKGIA